MANIKKIIAREILDSRGFPTIEAIVELDDAAVGASSVPTGASRGKFEAREIRDGDSGRFGGLGVLKALEKIKNILAPKLIGTNALDQAQIDQIMITVDGTADKSNLGANAILALSIAIAKAAAASYKIPLYQYLARLFGDKTNQLSIPTPMFNVINGGLHGGQNLDFQEFLLVLPKANKYSRNLQIGVETYYALKDVLKNHNASTQVGDEGGYAPIFYTNLEALKLLEEAVYKAGYKVGLDVFFSLDVAASQIIQGGNYRLRDRPVPLTADDLIEFYIYVNEQYRLLSIEDPYDQEDWSHWQLITSRLSNQLLIVGDDLIATNLNRLQKAIELQACSAIIIKPNQAGTITETLKVVKLAREHNLKIIVSHRSGETNDDFIADLSVGVGADYAKFGAPARGERVAKYNRLLEIEHELS